MMLVFLFVFLLEVHAILLTAGLLECGDVCHIRAAETGSDGGKPQIHKHPVIMISCQKFDRDQSPCLHTPVVLAVHLTSE